MSDFVSGFWSPYIAVVVIISIVFCFWLLKSQSVVKRKPGEKVESTGHVWDGDLEELNNPLPMWWCYLFYGTLIFGVVYLVLYPGLGSFAGTLGWTQLKQYQEEVKTTDTTVGPQFSKYLQTPAEQLAQDPQARQVGERLFLTYCAGCHGSDARGAKGFPNLRAKEWIWGGDAATIEATITHGRPAADDHGVQDTNPARMPAWGAILGEEKIRDVANYVISLSKPDGFDTARAARGKDVFAQNCIGCHGADAHGMTVLGAPNLTRHSFLYGKSEATLIETITNGRGGVMPAQQANLSKAKIHLLAAFVSGLPKDQ
jgi:cytochrome c oxidase cbb3-type subunit 3